MLVVTRFRVSEPAADSFDRDARSALAVLAGQPGCLGGRLAQSAEDPQLWLLLSEWDGVGSYRRALSAYDVRLRAVPVLARAVSEPGVYEVRCVEGAGPQGMRPSSRTGRDHPTGSG